MIPMRWAVLAALTWAGCGPASATVGPMTPVRAPAPPTARAAPGSLRVVLSAAAPFHLCVQREIDRARCVRRVSDGAWEDTDLAIHGWVVRVEPWVRSVDGARIVDAPRPRHDADETHAPFPLVDVAPLTLGVTCGRSADGRIACDAFEAHGDFRPVLEGGAPLAAASIASTADTLLALDASGRLLCVGRQCELLEAQLRATAREDLPEPDPSLASGSPWPVGPDLPPAMVIADSVARVRTDGLGAACIEDRRHRVVCHAGRYAPTVEADVTGALDFAFAGNDLCVLRGPVESARLACRYHDRDGAATEVLTAEVPGAHRLHAGGTTLCVETDAALACTELRGRSPAAPLSGVPLL